LRKCDGLKNVIESTGIQKLVEETEAALTGGSNAVQLMDGIEDEGIDEDLDDIATYTQCLVDLGPSIRISFQNYRMQEVTGTIIDFADRLPSQYYSEHVERLFPNAPKIFIERLGRASWERTAFVRDTISKNEEQDEVLNIEEQPALSFASRSQFHDSGIGSSLPAKSVYAYTLAPSSLKRGVEYKQSRIPPLSEGARRGDPFPCVGCGRKIQVKSTQEYRYGV
jgi:hypothetical protein